MAHMAKRTRLGPEERREQLLGLGVRLLSVKRLEELSIDVLAEVAGISRGLLYHYFSNKRDFHLAVLRRMSEEIVAITAPVEGAEPLEQLMASLTAYVDFVSEKRDAYVSFVRAAAAGDAAYQEIYEQARSALVDRIFDSSGSEVLAGFGATDGPPLRLLVRGWSAMVEDVVLSWLEDDRGIDKAHLVAMLAGSLATIGGVVAPVH